MTVSSSFSLIFSIILITTHFHLLSHASPLAYTYRPHHHGQLRTAIRQSTSSTANGGTVTVELWCVAKNNAENSALQKALDWACGPGGADCGPIQQGGPCYDLADVLRMASYAFNDYCLKHGMTEESCNFDGNAALTSLNPSHGNCKLPSSSTMMNGNATATSTVGLGPSGTSADQSGCNDFAAASPKKEHFGPVPLLHCRSQIPSKNTGEGETPTKQVHIRPTIREQT